MSKDEMKNKCAERAKIFQQAMENCKSSSPIDCIEWFADRIAELENGNAGLKETVTKMNNVIIETFSKLTKAKELLNEFMRIGKASDEDFEHDYSELIGEADQFLKEE